MGLLLRFADAVFWISEIKYRIKFWLKFRLPKCEECQIQTSCKREEVERGSHWCLTCHYSYKTVEEWFAQWDD